jgi:hypothetical protein
MPAVREKEVQVKKADYLQLPIVQGFVEWLGNNLENKTFAHNYLQRRTQTNWQCTSLYDAYCQYRWPQSGALAADFSTNVQILDRLRLALRNAIDLHSDDTLARSAAVDVMAWGGVRNGNVSWLMTNEKGLADTLIRVRNGLNAADTEQLQFLDASAPLRFNSGMSKVYSLLCDDLVIYDSRVAAALGLAVTRFCEQQGVLQTPAELSFPWAPAKTAIGARSSTLRDPARGSLHFPRLRSGRSYAEWNLKASWLLLAVLDSDAGRSSKFAQLGQLAKRLRALEAALFMIGYDLHGDLEAMHPQEALSDELAWNECFTKSRSKSFHYRLEKESILVQQGVRFRADELDATLTILRDEFGETPFPLANQADTVATGKARMGLGTAYFKATGKPAPHSSRLAAILEELGLFTRERRPGTNALHWRLNYQALGFDTLMCPIGMRTVLTRLQQVESEL